MKTVKGLEHLTCRQAEKAGPIKAGAVKAQGDLNNVFEYLMGGVKNDGARLFSVVPSDRTDNGHKLKYRKFYLNVQKRFFLL